MKNKINNVTENLKDTNLNYNSDRLIDASTEVILSANRLIKQQAEIIYKYETVIARLKQIETKIDTLNENNNTKF